MAWDEQQQVDFFVDGRAGQALTTRFDSAELLELHHRPGAGVSGLFEVSAADQARYFVLTTEELGVAGAHLDRLWTDAGLLLMWEHPEDPKLPGLELASVPERVAETWGNGRDLLDLETVTYRPLRRAVLRARFVGQPAPIYLKVLRAGAAELAYRHQVLAAAGVPVPGVVEPVSAEVLAITTVSGTPLAQAFIESTALPLPPARLLETMRRFPADLLTLPRKEAWAERVLDYGDAASVALPKQRNRIVAAASRAKEIVDTQPSGPLTATHGDLYEANLFVDDGKVTGVIDIDGAGPGYLVDDLACFVAHLAVLPTIDSGYAHTTKFLASYVEEFGAELESQGASRAGFLARTAAVVISLIAGARDEEVPDWEAVAQARLSLAEGFLDF